MAPFVLDASHDGGRWLDYGVSGHDANYPDGRPIPAGSLRRECRETQRLNGDTRVDARPVLEPSGSSAGGTWSKGYEHRSCSPSPSRARPLVHQPNSPTYGPLGTLGDDSFATSEMYSEAPPFMNHRARGPSADQEAARMPLRARLPSPPRTLAEAGYDFLDNSRPIHRERQDKVSYNGIAPVPFDMASTGATSSPGPRPWSSSDRLPQNGSMRDAPLSPHAPAADAWRSSAAVWDELDRRTTALLELQRQADIAIGRRAKELQFEIERRTQAQIEMEPWRPSDRRDDAPRYRNDDLAASRFGGSRGTSPRHKLADPRTIPDGGKLQTSVVIALRVHNVDYQRLTTNKRLLVAFEENIKRAIAAWGIALGVEGLAQTEPVDISVIPSGSYIEVEAMCALPPGSDRSGDMRSVLSASSSLTANLVDSICMVPNLEAMRPGRICVDSVRAHLRMEEVISGHWPQGAAVSASDNSVRSACGDEFTADAAYSKRFGAPRQPEATSNRAKVKTQGRKNCSQPQLVSAVTFQEEQFAAMPAVRFQEDGIGAIAEVEDCQEESELETSESGLKLTRLKSTNTLFPALKLQILSARGLRHSKSSLFSGTSKSSKLPDPYCVCQIAGKPHSKIQTPIIDNQLNPEWNYNACLLDYTVGDTLVFKILDSHSIKSDDLLGRATLQPFQFHPHGFSGELSLVDAGKGISAFLKVKVAAYPHGHGTELGSNEQDLNGSKPDTSKPIVMQPLLKGSGNHTSKESPRHSPRPSPRQSPRSPRQDHEPRSPRQEHHSNEQQQHQSHPRESTQHHQQHLQHPRQSQPHESVQHAEAEVSKTTTEESPVLGQEDRYEEVGEPLLVTIVGAEGLRKADWRLFGESSSDPYCICEIDGKPGCKKIQTKVIDKNINPVWNHDAWIVGFVPGDVLKFSVYDKDVGKTDDFLGWTSLQTDDFYPQGFDDRLALSDAGKNQKAFLHIKVQTIKSANPAGRRNSCHSALMRISDRSDPIVEGAAEHKAVLVKQGTMRRASMA